MMKPQNCIYHLIFETRDVGLAIPEAHRHKFFSEIALLLDNRHCSVYAIGGDMNHVHIITEIPAKKSFKPLIDKIKVISAAKAADILETGTFCGWLKGYISFTIDKTELPYWVDYVDSQAQIHSEINWMQEKRQLMKYF